MDPPFNRYPFGFYPHFGIPRLPYKQRYRNFLHNETNVNQKPKPEPEFDKENNEDENLRFLDDSKNPIFEIFGIKLFFDDVLLISLIFFLYNEGVHDQYLFIALILLLLS